MQTQSILLEPIVNPHSHIREADEKMGRYLQLIHNGGVETILPMPNTTQGLRTAAQVNHYTFFARNSGKVKIIPCFMLTELTTIQEIEECAGAGIMDAKVYPLNRTTKSENGVTHYASILPLIKKCGELGIRVHVHPEHPNMIYSNRDAEYAFLAIVQIFLEETSAVIIWEHGTDARCIPFWRNFALNGRFFVTLTAHHLATNEDQTFGDVRSVCKPPIKTELDRIGLVGLVAENHPWVMAGADDAPHDITAKHVHSGQCACGAYTAPFLMQLYAHALQSLFETDGGRLIFINFTSRNARRLYGLENATKEIALHRKPYIIPGSCQIGMNGRVEPFWAGRTIDWVIAE